MNSADSSWQNTKPCLEVAVRKIKLPMLRPETEGAENMKERNISLFWMFICFMAFDSAIAWGQKNLFEMSLTELMDLEVSVASKTVLPVHDAPGIVTAYNRFALDLFGYNSFDPDKKLAQ